MTASPDYDVVVVGGGAAGYFGAISAAEFASRPLRILVLEQSKRTLQKVRISGGGRCNLTHAEFDPGELTKAYPRGQLELLGPFTKFAPGDTMAWFEDQGVSLKIESDGRVFPLSDDSESIVQALNGGLRKHNIALRTQQKVTGVRARDKFWELGLLGDVRLSAKQVLLATGSAPSVYRWLDKLGVKLVDPVPSLFTFKVDLPTLHELAGLSVNEVRIRLPQQQVETRGPLLITHWGFSGPAILRASAEAAVDLYHKGYKTCFSVSWTHSTPAEALQYIEHCRKQIGKQELQSGAHLELPKRLWRYLIERADLAGNTRWADLTKADLLRLSEILANDSYDMSGQNRFKAEFVTAGGIDLRELDFRSFSLKRYPGLYAAGELLDIDGITGGFNFQAAWTGGYLAGKAIAAAAKPGG